MKHLIPFLTIFLLTSMACALPVVNIDSAPEPTNTAPFPSPTTTLVIPIEASPTQLPSLPGTVEPIALAIVRDERAVLSIIDPGGQVLGEISAAGLENAEPGRAHFAGRWSAGQTPLVFYTFANGGQILLHAGGQTSLVTNAPMFISLAGATAEPILAYSTGEYSQIGMYSQLFVNPTDTLSAAGAVISHDDPESRAIYPLAIRTQGGAPIGVWYTLRPWGIGGDIVFDPSDGLYFVDLRNGTILDYQEHVQRNASLSPDHAWAASEAGEPGTTTFRIYNLDTSEEHDFPLLPASDRGAGYGVFSPSSRNVAWMEGSGWQMADPPTFHATIRVGTTGGDWLLDYPDTSLSTLLGTPVTWAQPMGWLNDQVLVLQVRGATWRDAMVVLLDITANQAVQLSPGTFAAFIYP